MPLDPVEVDRLNALVHRLRVLTLKWPVTDEMAPVNLAEERVRVAEAAERGQLTAPSFVYPDPERPIDELQIEAATLLSDIDTDRTLWDKLICSMVREHTRTIAAARSHDAEQITALTAAAYGSPSAHLLHLAKRIVDEPFEPDANDRPVSADEAASRFRSILTVAGFDDWSVEVVEHMQARMAVNSPLKLLRVSAVAQFAEPDLRRLIVHEIGTHVFRTANANAQRLAALATPFGVSAPTEEGLAVFNESRLGLTTHSSLRTYALRVMAAHWSLTMPFTEVLERLLTYTGAPLAVEIAVRAKRGFSDLEAHGAHLKDISYLMGYLQVARHCEAHPEDYDLLMSTKQPLEQIRLLRKVRTEGDLELWPRTPEHELLPGPNRDWVRPDGDPLGLCGIDPDQPLSELPQISVDFGPDLATELIARSADSLRTIKRFSGRTVLGDVVLDDATLPSTLEFRDCIFRGEFLARNASLKSLRFENCEIDGIDLSGSSIDGEIEIQESRIGTGSGYSIRAYDARIKRGIDAQPTPGREPSHFTGTIDLELLRAGGRINFAETRITGNEKRMVTGRVMPVGITVTRAQADGGLRLRGAVVHGQVRGIGFVSVGQTNLAGISIYAPENDAVQFQRSVLSTSILLRGAVIEGSINMSGTRCAGTLLFQGMRLTKPKNGTALKLNLVDCDQVRFDGSDKANPISERVEQFSFERAAPFEEQSRTYVEGTLEMRSANISSHVVLDCMEIRAQSTAIDMTGAEVGGEFLGRQMTLSSSESVAFNVDAAILCGRIDLTGTVFCGGLNLANTKIAAFARLRECRFIEDGSVLSLAGARIGADVDFTLCRFSNAMSVSLTGSKVEGALVWRELPRPAALVLDSAHIHELDDDPQSWPAAGELHLEGATIEQFANTSTSAAAVKQRLGWLARQERFAPGPYQGLASNFRQRSEDRAARQVMIELQRRHVTSIKNPWRRFWGRFWFMLTGYGYRLQGLGIVALLITALSIASAWWALSQEALIPAEVGANALVETCTSDYPCFDPVMFGLDAVIPIADLQQTRFWVPDRSMWAGALFDKCLQSFTLLGWLTLSAAAAGVSQRIRG